MSASNKNPLIPNSLAADGMQGGRCVSVSDANVDELIADLQAWLYLAAEYKAARAVGGVA